LCTWASQSRPHVIEAELYEEIALCMASKQLPEGQG
jgi:hypothetical protein